MFYKEERRTELSQRTNPIQMSKRRRKPSLYGAIFSLFDATSFKMIKAERAVHGRQPRVSVLLYGVHPPYHRASLLMLNSLI